MAEFSFYITLYKDKVRRNLEQFFNCKYRELKGLLEFGSIKNVYIEDYAERSLPRLYIPEKDSLTRNTTDCTLTVLFDSNTCIADSLKLQDYIQGQMFEWYDTFRGKYATFILIDQPKISTGEILYGNRKFRDVTYNLKNLYGECYSQSRL